MPATTELSGLDAETLYNSLVTPIRRGAGAAYSLKYHLVWCPKYRRPVLVDAVAERLKVLLHDKAATLGLRIHALEVMPDHVHVFVEDDPTFSPAHLAHQFKGYIEPQWERP